MLWAILSLLLLVAAEHDEGRLCRRGAVVELDGSNFDAAISECRNILVDFYAPCEYPTLKLFVDGIHTDYRGPHKAELMVAHLRRMLAPPLSTLQSPSAVKQFVERAGDKLPVFVGFGVEVSTLAELAQGHRLRAWFATVDQEGSASELDLLSSDYGLTVLPALLVQHSSMNEQAVFHGPFQGTSLLFLRPLTLHGRSFLAGEGLASFVRHNLLPPVTTLTYDNLELVKADGRPVVLAIVTGAGVFNHMKELAREHPEMLFALLNSSSPLADIFYASKVLVWDGKTYFYTISALVEDFKNNKVKRSIIKQPSFMEQLMGFIGQNVLYIVLFFVTIVVFLQSMDWAQPGAARH
ncbi:protein disulfide-isomerase 5-2 [Selaginella moellendorffii]|uniref:protein disulfide-isomerase 5-2 n=1 Tax=Selaginella moellendorffii TaxID=88036 RepID=UPI000D1C8016|nr:protein disulfide-isomerase 5-2 [Selaginella moellendorffii]|eukprot:XP_024527287.1 protein disulfide-isomerase 5-2 [Selaginella moellendorffii]